MQYTGLCFHLRCGLSISQHLLFIFQRENTAATVIQSFVRSFQTRKKLKATSQAFSKFQKSYRKRINERRFHAQQSEINKTRRIHEMHDRREEFVKSKVQQLKVVRYVIVLPGRAVSLNKHNKITLFSIQ